MVSRGIQNYGGIFLVCQRFISFCKPEVPVGWVWTGEIFRNGNAVFLAG
jgi:hypothetical protein